MNGGTEWVDIFSLTMRTGFMPIWTTLNGSSEWFAWSNPLKILKDPRRATTWPIAEAKTEPHMSWNRLLSVEPHHITRPLVGFTAPRTYKLCLEPGFPSPPWPQLQKVNTGFSALFTWQKNAFELSVHGVNMLALRHFTKARRKFGCQVCRIMSLGIINRNMKQSLCLKHPLLTVKRQPASVLCNLET